MLTQGVKELESLLTGLIKEKNKYENSLVVLKEKDLKIEKLKLTLENKIKQLEAEERKFVQETKDEVVYEATELYKEIQKAVRALRKERTKEKMEQAKQVLTDVHEQLKGGVWQEQSNGTLRNEIKNRKAITVGETIRLKDTNISGTVVAISKERKQIEVQTGQLKINVKMDSVEKLPASLDQAVPSHHPTVKRQNVSTIKKELNLLGKRASEIEGLLDAYINDAFMTNCSEIRIIHGIGTGTVRKIVRELLASHPLVKCYRPGKHGEGSEGATIVQL
jgi:DNA mismatch repair protein MutS2